ncbi:MAG: type II secretion system F family protein, partial [Betaproteobacteria bacterium]
MTAFRYEAADALGHTETGLIDADSPRHARAMLRERGLTPLEVNPLQVSAGQTATALGPRLRSGDLALATRQLASLLAARLPLEQALDVVIEQADRRLLRERFAAVRAEVVSGQSFANALARFPRDFPEVYRALVSAGEQSGDLAGVMTRLADYVEARGALAQRVALAFIYPAIVTVVASVVVMVLLTYVVPQVVEVFRQTGQALPWLTRALIALSDFTRHWGWALALAVLTCWIGW